MITHLYDLSHVVNLFSLVSNIHILIAVWSCMALAPYHAVHEASVRDWGISLLQTFRRTMSTVTYFQWVSEPKWSRLWKRQKNKKNRFLLSVVLYYYDHRFTHVTKKIFRQISKIPINREKFISRARKNRRYALCEPMVVVSTGRKGHDLHWFKLLLWVQNVLTLNLSVSVFVHNHWTSK